MGSRIHVFLSHDQPRYDDAAKTIMRLNYALPAALAVRDYWCTVNPGRQHTDDHWEVKPITPWLPNMRLFSGPGSVNLALTAVAARVSTGCRWSGFLSIRPLRAVHLAAFRAIAEALGSPTMAICADVCDDVTEVFLADGSQDECIAKLHAVMGPPQPSIGLEISPKAEQGVHGLWFLDSEPTYHGHGD